MGIWDLGFEGLKILGFGIWGVKLFGIWDLGKIFGIWDLRLINLNMLSEIHILLIYKILILDDSKLLLKIKYRSHIT